MPSSALCLHYNTMIDLIMIVMAVGSLEPFPTDQANPDIVVIKMGKEMGAALFIGGIYIMALVCTFVYGFVATIFLFTDVIHAIVTKLRKNV